MIALTPDELEFHMRALCNALAAAVATVDACRAAAVDDAAGLRERLGSLEALVVDDLGGHVRSVVDASPPAAASPPTPVPSDEPRTQLAQQLEALATALADAAALVAAPAPMLDRLDMLVSQQAMPAVRAALTLAVALHRAADPMAAHDDDQADELATPLREVALEGARVLVACPHCGGALGRADRTFDGSYCEACRTRFRAH